MEIVLPDEVIVSEILTRVSLPCCSLRQFQWVCRDWHNLIHESKFQLIHSNRAPIVASGFFLVMMERYAPNVSDSIRFFPFNDDQSGKNPSPSLDFLPSAVAIAGSSPYGSLLCCVTLDKLQTTKTIPIKSIPIFYICKPATREWRKIPNPRTKFINHGMRIVVKQTYPTLQYKIVGMSATSGVILEYHHCEMFDSVTWAWKRLADLKTLSWLHDTFGGVFINGCLHWISHKRQIHVLSIEQEKWNAVIQLTADAVERVSHRYLLFLIDGKIGVLISNNECIELWVLENYYCHTSWKRRYHRDLRALNREVGGMCIPAAVSSPSIIFMICLCSNPHAIIYNMNDDTYTILASFPFVGFPFESRFCYI
ncbi:F-box protein At5g49610-like [Papaver somniferum]|uniref:F-box protein At5g49610-like n=1 Tax=Papaver somniferum TaxID=3469 RepID=UPI000E6F8E78|nr:F-box protein At5g49610-like [Papaver somniferum]